MPIKRSQAVKFLLAKTSLSTFNILPLLFFIPFSITLIVKGYHPLYALYWFVRILALIFFNNYANYLINKTKIYFAIILGTIAGLLALQNYDIFDITAYADIFFHGIYTYPVWILVPIILMVYAFYANYQYYMLHFYIDGAVSQKTEKVKALDLKFVDKFGKDTPFLKNDIKLILRNTRPKQVLLMSFVFLFYGGALNRVPVELNVKAKAFQNTNGFNVTQLLISIPKIIGPMIIYYIPYKLISFDAGIIILALSGLLGLVFQNQFLNLIENIYQ